MLYYKKIEIDKFQELVDGALFYLREYEPHAYYRKLAATFYPLNFNQLSKVCPSVNTAFDKFNLKCTYAAVYVMYSNENSKIHIDCYQHDCRINIPLLNCIGTKTLFFTGGEFEKVYNPVTNTVAERIVSLKNLRLVDYVEIDKPVVIRVNEPHMVTMNIKHTPRITLTLGFDRDPKYLLEII